MLGQIFSSKFSFQKPAVYWLLFLLISTGTVYNFLTSYHCKSKVGAVIVSDAGMTVVSVNAAS